MKQKARIYARVSRDEQVKYGYSIDAQLTALKEYCNQNKITISFNIFLCIFKCHYISPLYFI